MRNARNPRRGALEMLRTVDTWTDTPNPGHLQTIEVALLGIGYALLDIADAIRETKGGAA